MIKKISNGKLFAEIDTLGAELKSLKTAEGKQIIWQTNPNIWKGSSPILFPICGGLIEDSYILDGKSYTLKKHGFAKLNEFSVVSENGGDITFLLKDTPETRKQFPFAFNFFVTFTLTDNALVTDYKVENLDDKTMYYSVGSHEAYQLTDKLDNYVVRFEKEEKLENYELVGNYLRPEPYFIGDNISVFPLKTEYFAVDALVFKNLKSKSVTLEHKNGEKIAKVDFPQCDYFLLWTKPNADYICLEPWSGIPDTIGFNQALEKKEGIISLESKAVKVISHTVTAL